MSDHVEVTFKCKQCGHGMLSIAEPVTDDSAVKCGSCGVDVGRWGDIKAKARKVVADRVTDAFTKGLGKGWKRKL